ncbi:MAG: nucleotide-binding protein [Comamonadaceae bacterium CG_4_9_14_0_8_um_filter_60_18]|nr:nucleotide-binding protein [Rhodoferax sp.]OIP22247.1 MAG: nucleotide-binding protein [Comamonadaceae bacterium CG2_30_60_41]PIW10272.1 MAG: nucleotide-binding protein [Comamonadaceae bacterium CG17_big_fil_post_rev_8_21_14_2_50_60_13]PIY23981.1 MAG: nucleotide-binding protein [Comamonadaceae bacterium CG_4_10_14_3_um_filter_60_75]PJC15158.1 MAG: nucleotide-binding protein [Comamonadaceae bacterium CG_4_9_14_0_8_um_filter_60_18]
MKRFFAIALMLCTGVFWGASAWAETVVIKGQVLEVKDVEDYTYMLLKTPTGDTWTAVSKAPVIKGATVTIVDAEQMDNFESKTLKKKFTKIFFGKLEQPKLTAAQQQAQVAAAHGEAAKAPVLTDVKVPKATGADAYTVAELVTKASALKDKPVLLRAKVVKFSPNIMNKNWVHLRDGSGAAKDGSDDILLTTQEQVKVGDVVQIKGVLRNNKDFGAGYVYPVIIEDGKLHK